MDHKNQKSEAESLSALKRIAYVPPDATDIERKAMIFAYKKHSEVHQKRKYSGKHYIVHPAAVAELVRSVDHTPEMLADLIHNSKSITAKDPGFAKVYMREMRDLLNVLKEGDSTLWDRAYEIAY